MDSYDVSQIFFWEMILSSSHGARYVLWPLDSKIHHAVGRQTFDKTNLAKNFTTNCWRCHRIPTQIKSEVGPCFFCRWMWDEFFWGEAQEVLPISESGGSCAWTFRFQDSFPSGVAYRIPKLSEPRFVVTFCSNQFCIPQKWHLIEFWLKPIFGRAYLWSVWHFTTFWHSFFSSSHGFRLHISFDFRSWIKMVRVPLSQHPMVTCMQRECVVLDA